MRHYIGLDVSLKETHICVVDETAKIVWQGKCETLATSIAACVDPFGHSIEVVALETGGQSSWLQQGLRGLGLPAVIVDARRAKAALSCRLNKTDRNDAEGLAQLARTRWYREVAAKSENTRFIRSQLLGRHLLVKQLRDIQNQIRGILRGLGLQVGRVSRMRFEARIWELISDHPALEPAMAALLSVRRSVIARINDLDKSLSQLCKGSELCRRLMSVPGVGPLVCLSFITAIDDPKRFQKSSSVGAYLGLTPRIYQSGDTLRCGRISKYGDNLSRHMLYEAANVLLTNSKGKWSKLKAWGMKLVQKIGSKKARVAVARKLSVILHRIWMDGTEFSWGNKEVAA